MQFRHGDSQVLNCLESHPHLPLTMATSGALRMLLRDSAVDARGVSADNLRG